MKVNQVTTRKVPFETAAAHKGFPLAGLKRKDLDIGAIGIRKDSTGKGGEQDSLAARQDLRVKVRRLALLPVQLRHGRGRAAGGRNS